MKPSTLSPSLDWYRRFGKRALDLVGATTVLVLTAPVMLVVGLLVRRRLGTPVLFRQERPGLEGRPFAMLKFRTMTDARDETGTLLPDGQRLTDFGKLLRRTSLDELPEFWNVIRGEMSIIGPRPLLMRYYPYFTEGERLRFTVRPGITGLAQVSGRNDLSWDNRIATDVEYVRNLSWKLDVKILLMTVQRVIGRQGFQDDPGAVMLDFDVERRQRATTLHVQPDAPHHVS